MLTPMEFIKNILKHWKYDHKIYNNRNGTRLELSQLSLELALMVQSWYQLMTWIMCHLGGL